MRSEMWVRHWVPLVVVCLAGWVACHPVTPPTPDGVVKEAAKEPSTPEPASADEPSHSPDPVVPVDAAPDVSATDAVTDAAGGEVAPEAQPTNQPYQITLFDKAVIHSTGKVNVRNVTTTFRFRNQTFAKLTLHIELRSPCYPFEKWEKPPQGHNWPANCDAYDRNMNVTWNPPKKDGDPPGFDLVRIITPFGGPLDAGVNVTDLGNALAKKLPMGQEHEMKIQISTYSDGKGQVSGSAGTWIVSAYLKVTPGTPPRNILAAIPLFNHNYKHNDSKKESATFTLPPGTKSSQLFYTVTGHGGGTADSACIGHADEFCRRTHRLFADDQMIFQFIPWRTDCAKLCTETQHPFNARVTYCKENPCGSKASVRASRANWCPGSITYPEIQKPAAFQTPGEHTFSYQVAKVAKGGSWRVSAILYAYGE